MRLSSSSCMRAKTASRASRLPASRSSPMPYSTPRTDRVFGSAAADQHLARRGGRGGCPDISGTPDAPIRTAVARAGSRNRQTRPDLFVCSRRASIGSASREAAVARGAPASFGPACATTPSISTSTRFTALPRAPGASACRPRSASPPPPWPGKRRCWSPRCRDGRPRSRHARGSAPAPGRRQKADIPIPRRNAVPAFSKAHPRPGPDRFPSRFSATPGRVQLRQFLVQDDGRRSRPDDPGEAWRQYSLETASLKSEPGQPATLGSPSTPQNRGTLRKRG